MKKTITLPVPSHSKIEVKNGEKITEDTLLYSHSNSSYGSQEIPVAQLLRIKEVHILKYLVKSMGQVIADGEIIAVKKSFFAKDIVRSPLAGKIESVDLKKGIVTVTSARSSKGEYRIPTSAIVKEVTDSSILLEIAGEIFTGEKGKGTDAVGPLYQIGAKHVNALDIREDVEGVIVMGRNFDEDALIKCDVLQAAGYVSLAELSGQPLPWVSFSESEYAKLAQHAGKNAWLIPSISTIVII